MHLNASTITATNRNANENAVGYSENMAWVIDGLAGCGQSRIQGWSSDAQWYAQRLNKILESADSKMPLKEILLLAHSSLITEYKKLIGASEITESTFPSAEIALIKLTGHQLESYILGSCTLQISTVTDVQTIRDSRMESFIQMEISKQKADSKSKNLISEFETDCRKFKNKKNGFWVMDYSENSIYHGVTGKFPICDQSEILLMSGGFSRVLSPFNLYSDPKILIADISHHGLQYVWNQISKTERNDPECKQFVRFAPWDDCSAVFMQVQK